MNKKKKNTPDPESSHKDSLERTSAPVEGDTPAEKSQPKIEDPNNKKTSSEQDSLIIWEDRLQEILLLKENINEHKNLKVHEENKRKELRQLLKPISKAKKKLRGKKAIKLSPEDRKVAEAKLRYHKNRLIWIKEQIKLDSDKLKMLALSEKNKQNLQNLRDNSNTKAYTTRNQFFIKQKLLAAINEILQGSEIDKKEKLSRLRQLAFATYEEANQEFNQLLSELLEETDKKTYILSSGKLKNKLYEAAKLTFQHYNPKQNVIDKLIFPEDLEEKEIVEMDPLEKNKTLIQSLMLGFLNQSLEKPTAKEMLYKLNSLSREEKDEEFYSELNEFIYSEDPELYIICSGALKTRLYNAFKLTLKDWDTAGETKFSEIIFEENAENTNSIL